MSTEEQVGTAAITIEVSDFACRRGRREELLSYYSTRKKGITYIA